MEVEVGWSVPVETHDSGFSGLSRSESRKLYVEREVAAAASKAHLSHVQVQPGPPVTNLSISASSWGPGVQTRDLWMTLHKANCNWDRGSWIQLNRDGDLASPRAQSEHLWDVLS